ncbi:MAG: flavodoxin [Synergistaceae bacterium]|jgi:flavodoxin short chain|nr:flavodoxin [Synergistaceae bacterium]
MAKIGIIYWSGTGNTEKMAELIEQGAKGSGADVTRKNVASASSEELAGYDVVVLGSPSMGAEVVEEDEMAPFVSSAAPALKDKKVALFGSYGWGDGEWMRNWSSDLKNAGVKLLDDGLTVHETPEGESADLCVEYGKKIAAF